MPYAKETYALGLCDRCQQRYKLKELKYETTNFKRTNRRVCADCFDIDHEQFRLTKIRVADGFPLRDARPQIDTDQGYNWRDMFGNVTAPIYKISAVGAVGKVTVTIT